MKVKPPPVDNEILRNHLKNAHNVIVAPGKTTGFEERKRDRDIHLTYKQAPRESSEQEQKQQRQWLDMVRQWLRSNVAR